MRHTKIVCTLGPASSSREQIRALIAAGLDVARMNFSHGTHEEHAERIRIVREEAREAGRVIPILQDLQGPKIRVGHLPDEGIELEDGAPLILTAEETEPGVNNRVFVSYPDLSDDVQVGRNILIDDGNLELKVVAVDGTDVVTEVVVGGRLKSRKGVNLPHIKTSRPALTQKDLEDLEFGLKQNVDYIALSFVRSASDVQHLIEHVRSAGKNVRIISKIEKPEAVRDFDGILKYSDGIMVARGDLGIEMPLSEVPMIQKRIIRKCLAASKPVITATQMLESMMENPRPTRAEASDVANAVLDGSDAVMLSGETAAGQYPVRVVQVMDRIISQTESMQRWKDRVSAKPPSDLSKSAEVTRSIAHMAVKIARQVDAKAIACLTHSGSTARHISSFRPDVPIFAFTDEPRSLAQVNLSWGSQGFHIPFQRNTDAG
ncbi:MAG: pyruvate kinase, partial [Bacteroidota bacterium]